MVSHNTSSSSTLADIIMMSSKVMVATRSKDNGSKSPSVYGNDFSSPGHSSTSTPPPSEPLQIEKPNPNMVIQLPPNGVL